MYDGVAVYRHYNKDGELLYVGQSQDPNKRLTEHRCRSVWARLVSNSKIIWFATRHQALIEEAIAIIEENPLHNKYIPTPAFVRNFDEASVDRMNEISEIIEKAGGNKAVCAALSVSKGAIRQRYAIGSLPASWFDALEELAGESLPRSAFSFRNITARGDAPPCEALRGRRAP